MYVCGFVACCCFRCIGFGLVWLVCLFVCLFVCLSRCLCLRLCVCLRLCHRLRLCLCVCLCLCVSLLPVLEKHCCGAEKTPLCTKNTVWAQEKHLGCWKNTVLELRKHHCGGAEKTPRVWRKHLDAQKIPARCWENTHSLMLKNTSGCGENTWSSKNTFLMLQKHRISGVGKTPQVLIKHRGCWENPGCWKNTFWMLKKFLMLEKHHGKAAHSTKNVVPLLHFTLNFGCFRLLGFGFGFCVVETSIAFCLIIAQFLGHFAAATFAPLLD